MAHPAGQTAVYNKVKQRGNRYKAFNWNPVYGPHHSKNIMDDYLVAPIGMRTLVHAITTSDSENVAYSPVNWMSIVMTDTTMGRRRAVLPPPNAGGSGSIGSICMNGMIPTEEWVNRNPQLIAPTLSLMRNHYNIYRVTSTRVVFTCDVNSASLASGTSKTWGIGLVYSPSPLITDHYTVTELRDLVDTGRISVKPCYSAASYADQRAVLDTGWVNIMGQFQPEVSTFGPPEVAAFMGLLGATNSAITNPDTLLYCHPFMFVWDTDGTDAVVDWELQAVIQQKVFFYDPKPMVREALGQIDHGADATELEAITNFPFDHTEEAESAFDQPVTAFNLGKRKRTELKIVENDTNIPEDKCTEEKPVDIEPDVQILSPLK